MNRSEVLALRKPLALLAAIVIAAGAALHFLWQRVEDAEQRLRQENGRAREAQLRLQLSGREREMIVQHLDAYRALERAGFVAPEQRINWVTGLRNANQAAGLFGIEYQIGAQRTYRAAPQLDVPQLEVLESTMRLKAALLHEEDLMRLLGALEEQHLGLFLLEECTVKRLPVASGLRYQPQLDADCRMAWLTAHARAAGPR
jgi:hypothetical protein